MEIKLLYWDSIVNIFLPCVAKLQLTRLPLNIVCWKSTERTSSEFSPEVNEAEILVSFSVSYQPVVKSADHIQKVKPDAAGAELSPRAKKATTPKQIY